MESMQFSLGRLMAAVAALGAMTAVLLRFGWATATAGTILALPLLAALLFPGNARIVLPVSYLSLILFPCLIAALAMQLPAPLIAVTFVVYAFAFLPTYFLDHSLLGGIGYHSPLVFVLLATVVALSLWPLGVLSANPSCWRRRRWRRAFLAYLGALVCSLFVSGWQMITNWARFFG
jgi:hypothetical protein